MKLPLTFLAAVLAAAPALPAQAPPATAPPAKAARALLEACPKPVRDTIGKAAAGGTVTKLRAVRRGDQTLYIADIEREKENPLKLQVRADGSVARSTEDIPSGAAPAPVRQSLTTLAGPGGEIRGLKKITEGETVFFKAGIDRNGQPDLNVRVAPDGVILEQKEDTDD